jgi:hypothetical protein
MSFSPLPSFRRRLSARSASKPSCQKRLAMPVPFFPRMSLMESPDPAMIPSLPPGHQLISCPSSEESRHSDLFLSLAAAMANAHQSGQRVLAWCLAACTALGAEQVSKGLPMADILALRRFALGSPESQCGRNAVRRQQCDLRLDADDRVGIQCEPVSLSNGG